VLRGPVPQLEDEWCISVCLFVQIDVAVKVAVRGVEVATRETETGGGCWIEVVEDGEFKVGWQSGDIGPVV